MNKSKVKPYLSIVASIAAFSIVLKGLFTGRLSLPGSDPSLGEETAWFVISSSILFVTATYVLITSIRQIRRNKESG